MGGDYRRCDALSISSFIRLDGKGQRTAKGFFRCLSHAAHGTHATHTLRSHVTRVQTPFPTYFSSEGEKSFFFGVLVLTNSASSGAFAKKPENAEQNSRCSARTRVASLHGQTLCRESPLKKTAENITRVYLSCGAKAMTPCAPDCMYGHCTM